MSKSNLEHLQLKPACAAWRALRALQAPGGGPEPSWWRRMAMMVNREPPSKGGGGYTPDIGALCMYLRI